MSFIDKFHVNDDDKFYYQLFLFYADIWSCALITNQNFVIKQRLGIKNGNNVGLLATKSLMNGLWLDV